MKSIHKNTKPHCIPTKTYKHITYKLVYIHDDYTLAVLLYKYYLIN